MEKQRTADVLLYDSGSERVEKFDKCMQTENDEVEKEYKVCGSIV